MRGEWLHTEVLLKPVESRFLAHGATARREFPVNLPDGRGFIDCLIEIGSWRIACEAENSPKRIRLDVAKGDAARADWLLIITPRPRVARACARQLRGHIIPPSLRISFLTVGTAREWFANCFPLFTGANSLSKTNPAPIHSSINSEQKGTP
jgi:hypothetical protein